MNWREKHYRPLKVGDKVRCIINPNSRGSNEYNNSGRGSGWKKGKVFTIGDIEGPFERHNGQIIIWPTTTNGNNGVYGDEVELVKK